MERCELRCLGQGGQEEWVNSSRLAMHGKGEGTSVRRQASESRLGKIRPKSKQSQRSELRNQRITESEEESPRGQIKRGGGSCGIAGMDRQEGLQEWPQGEPRMTAHLAVIVKRREVRKEKKRNEKKSS